MLVPKAAFLLCEIGWMYIIRTIGTLYDLVR